MESWERVMKMKHVQNLKKVIGPELVLFLIGVTSFLAYSLHIFQA